MAAPAHRLRLAHVRGLVAADGADAGGVRRVREPRPLAVGKGDLREAQAEEFARGSEQPVPLGRALAVGRCERFQRVRVHGQFDPAHQFLLDNRTYDGRPATKC